MNKRLNIFLASVTILGIISNVPLASAGGPFNGYFDALQTNPPTGIWYTYACASCRWDQNFKLLATGSGNPTFTLSTPTQTSDWNIRIFYNFARPNIDSAGCISVGAGSAGFTIGYSRSGGTSNCNSGVGLNSFFSIGGVCSVINADTSLAKSGNVLMSFSRSTDQVTLTASPGGSCVSAVNTAYRTFTAIQFTQTGSIQTGDATHLEQFQALSYDFGDGHTYFTPDSTYTFPAGGGPGGLSNDKPIATVHTNYFDPPTVYAIEYGSQGLFDSSCQQSGVTNPCGTTIKLDQNLVQQTIGHSCNPQTVSSSYVDLDTVTGIGYNQAIGTDNLYSIECSGYLPGTPILNGWGLAVPPISMVGAPTSIWHDPSQAYRHVVRMAELNQNNVYVLLDNGQIDLIDLFTYGNGALDSSRLKATVNAFPANDLAQSSSGNGKIAVVTGTDNHINIYNSNLVLLSSTLVTNTPNSVAIYGNKLITCGTTTTIQYTIQTDNSLVAGASHAIPCNKATDTTAFGRQLKISKDGDFLTYINRTTTFKVDLYNVTLSSTMPRVFQSDSYGNVYSTDIDVLNKKLYIAETNGSPVGNIAQFDVSTVTTAFGRANNTFPTTGNPYLNSTVFPVSGTNNTLATTGSGGNGGTLGSGTGNDFLTVIINGWATFFPTGIDGAKWFLGILIVLWVTAAFYKVTHSGIGSAIGAFAGVGLAVGVGMIPIWFIMGLTFVIILVSASKIFRDSDDD